MGYDVTVIGNPAFNFVKDLVITKDYSIIANGEFAMLFDVSGTNPVITKNCFDFNAERIWRKLTLRWEEIHWADFYLNMLEKWVGTKIKFTFGKPAGKNKYVVIHPGAGDREKAWDISNYISIYKHIDYKDKFFVLGPGDMWALPEIKLHKCNYFISNSFNDLDKVARNTKLFIGSDSGVGHFFSMYPCKIMTFFTVGCADTHYPYTKNAIYYFDREIFTDFYKLGFIEHISPNMKEVYIQLSEFLCGRDSLLKNFYSTSELPKHL